MSVSENLQIIQSNITRACDKVNRQPAEITIIGITKYVDVEKTKELYDVGITNLGENRPEGLLHKITNIDEEVSWHFVGTLQSRKVKDVLGHVSAIHSLDRVSIAKEINKRASTVMDCFVQVNVSEEDAKHGLKVDEVVSFIEQLQAYELVRVVGLMTMAPNTDDKSAIRSVFRRLAEVREEVQQQRYPHAPCEFLSMGMSNDYEIAIEEGATHIRVGSKLVGN